MYRIMGQHLKQFGNPNSSLKYLIIYYSWDTQSPCAPTPPPHSPPQSAFPKPGHKGSLSNDDEPVALCVVINTVDRDSWHAVISFAGASAMESATEVPGSRVSRRRESPSCHRRSKGSAPDLKVGFGSYKNPFMTPLRNRVM